MKSETKNGLKKEEKCEKNGNVDNNHKSGQYFFTRTKMQDIVMEFYLKQNNYNKSSTDQFFCILFQFSASEPSWLLPLIR